MKDTTVEFSGLILGFSSAALTYMGFDVKGVSNGPKNLALAKQNIDIIKLLKEKSRGNLTDEEQSLINEILNDLMIKYASAS